jgi:hypothetical protein
MWFLIFAFSLIVVVFLWKTRLKAAVKNVKGNVPTLIVLGSGGHTAEMCQLLLSLSMSQYRVYEPRCYVLAQTDTMSEEKLRRLESGVQMVLLVDG